MLSEYEKNTYEVCVQLIDASISCFKITLAYKLEFHMNQLVTHLKSESDTELVSLIVYEPSGVQIVDPL